MLFDSDLIKNVCVRVYVCVCVSVHACTIVEIHPWGVSKPTPTCSTYYFTKLHTHTHQQTPRPPCVAAVQMAARALFVAAGAIGVFSWQNE